MKPRRKFLPLTYKQKIQAVQDGRCTQSIRIDTDLKVGDFIAFHGWEGRPYRSPWSFRTPYFKITLAKLINVHEDYVYFPESKTRLNIGDPYLHLLALKDGMCSPTGAELLQVLHGMHGPGTLHGKVLRWDPIIVRTVTPAEMTIQDLFEDEPAKIAPLAVPVLQERPIDPVVNRFLKKHSLSNLGKPREAV